MITLVMTSLILQEDSVATGIVPDAGVRLSVWIIGMFLLAVGGVLVYFRMKELSEREKQRSSPD